MNQLDLPQRSISRDGGARLALTAWLMSFTVTLVAFSFPNYFAYLPFTSGFDFRAVMGDVAWFGFLFLIFGPPFFFRDDPSSWSFSRRLVFSVGVLLYTVSTLAIKIYGLVVTGELWVGYLFSFPILFGVEWLLPALYLVLVTRRPVA